MAYYPSQYPPRNNNSHGTYPAAPGSRNPYGGNRSRYPQVPQAQYPPAQTNPHMPQRISSHNRGGKEHASPIIPGAAQQMDDEFVLYVLPNHKPSQRAQHLASQSDRVKITNINDLKGTCLPSWLDGAPLLHNEKTGKNFKGTMAITRLEEIKQNEVMPYDNAGKSIGYDNGSNQASTHTKGGSSMFIDPYLDDESLYADRGKKVTENDMQILLQKRNAQNQRFATKSH